MLPHLRWVCVQNGVKDRDPLRDEGNRWGKPSSSCLRRPWGSSAAKIGAIFSCSSLRLLLSQLVVAGLGVIKKEPRVRLNILIHYYTADDDTGGSRYPISGPEIVAACPFGPPALLKSARPCLQLPHSVDDIPT